jgi:hypothetical protein
LHSGIIPNNCSISKTINQVCPRPIPNMPQEKPTYFTYNSGIEAKRLHLGNLVHDFKLPDLYEPHVEKAYTE